MNKQTPAASGERDLLAFLPAALEIERTPPLPGSRAILWSIIGLFVLALLWACIGRVDVVAIANGKIVPSGQVKIVQPLETGIVTAIHVSEGQSVAAGDPLLQLDVSKLLNELRGLEGRRDAAATDIARLNTQLSALATYARTDSYFSRSPDIAIDATPDHTSVELKSRVTSALDEHYTQRAALEEAIRENRAERLGHERRLELLNETLPLIGERASAVKRLESQALASRLNWLDLEIPRIEQDRERDILRARLAAVDAAENRLVRRRSTLIAGARSDWLEARAALVTELQSVELAIEQTHVRLAERVLRAPVDGTVQQLKVHTVGGVVTPAQQLMSLVPSGDALAVDVWVANRDIGFMRVGAPVEIKIATFPFTKYGTISGRVEMLSNDAVADENLGLVYLAQASMSRATMRDGDRQVKLVPGMAVTMETRLGQRHLIEFLAAPLLRHLAEGFQER